MTPRCGVCAAEFQEASAGAQRLQALSQVLGNGEAFGVSVERIHNHGFGPGAVPAILIAKGRIELQVTAPCVRDFSTTRGLPGVIGRDGWVPEDAPGRGFEARRPAEVVVRAGRFWGVVHLTFSVHRDRFRAARFYQRFGLGPGEGLAHLSFERPRFAVLFAGGVP